MDYTQLIHNFVDGTLESIKEEELFYILSSNEDMRSELKQQLAIKEAVKADTKAFTPSAASTIKIFSTLGFPTPVGVIPSAISAGVIARLMQFFSRYTQGFVGAMVASLATAGIFLFLFNPPARYENNNNIIGKQNATVASNTVHSSEIPKVASHSNDGLTNEKTRVRYITKYRYIDVPRETQNSNTSLANQNDNVITNNDKSNSKEILASNLFETQTSNQIFSGTLHSNRYQVQKPHDELLSQFQQLQDLGFSIELMGNEYWYFDNPTINPKQLVKFNNSNINLIYSFNNYLSAGLEYRRENFFQKYSGKENDGSHYSYEQQPNFNSFGVVLRGYYPESFWNINPLIQLSAGGNNAGFLGRIMAGAKYEPYNNISFILGLEYSKLYYKHQGSNFSTDKIGLNYGVSVKF